MNKVAVECMVVAICGYPSQIWSNGPGPKHLKLRAEFGGLDRVSGPERNMGTYVKGLEGVRRQKWWERLAQKVAAMRRGQSG